MSSTPCARPTCRRMTTDPSGRCHDHRSAPRPPAAPLPVPALPTAGSVAPVRTVEIDDGSDRVYELYRLDGKLHRDDGPARVLRGADGSVISEGWFRHGELHREDGPAEVSYNVADEVVTEKWFRHGVLHREDGPADTSYLSMALSRHLTGVDERIWSRTEWHVEGELHRLGGPALSSYSSGFVHTEWRARGVPHRISGPAFESFRGSGKPIPQTNEWWVLGSRVTDRESIHTRLELASDERFREALLLSEFTELVADPEHVDRDGLLAGLRAGVSSVEGMRALLEGAPLEWVRAFEEERS